MTLDQITENALLEIKWLKYYATAESRSKIDLNSGVSIYDQLESIGYTKRVIDLHKRCAFLRVSSNEQITSSIEPDKLFKVSEYRDNSKNIYTALEYYIIWTPNYRQEIYTMLQ